VTAIGLGASPLFAGVSEAGLAEAGAAVVIEVGAGQVLVQAGDHGSGMYVVLDGEVVVELRGRRAEIGPGGFFGELALLVPDSERIARVRATTDARVASIPREAFEHLLDTEPAFARALLRELAVRFIEASADS
jgi:CRP-like cAMP-binding protein